MARDLKFPENFLWGAATSPTQVEGHVDNEWTNYVAADGGHCRVACDHYHRYEEDVDWMARLGVNAYRMGIEWSRLQAAPFAPLNRTELARYVHLLDCLKAANITPMVVLHHFSNPPWITSAGGWLNPAAVPAFVDYATKLVAALKERVYLWNTFNEPDTYASLTYLLGGFPPFHKWKFLAYRKTIKHMAEAHAQAGRIIRRDGGFGGRTPEVGIAKNWTSFGAFQKFALWDHLLAEISHHAFNRFVLDEFLGGRRREASTFLGVNYYGRARLNHFQALVPTNGVSHERLKQLGIVCDDMFERHPSGFGTLLKKFHRRYGLPHLHHRARGGFHRRGFPHPRSDGAFARIARRDGRWRGRARVFLLVAAGQFRVAVRLHEKIRPAVRGFQRRGTPAQDDARRRILSQRLQSLVGQRFQTVSIAV